MYLVNQGTLALVKHILQRLIMDLTDVVSEATKSTKPTIIGLYGASGSGKSHLLEQLRSGTGFGVFKKKRFALFESSALIGKVVDGGLAAFNQLSQADQHDARGRAILKTAATCVKSRKTGVIAANYMMWENEHDAPEILWTLKDSETYTHTVYLNFDEMWISKRRERDAESKRTAVSAQQIRKWQQREMQELREICREHDIFFTSLTDSSPTIWEALGQRSTGNQLATLLDDIHTYDEAKNTNAVNHPIDTACASYPSTKTVLLLDADKVLAPDDTRRLFWEETDLLTGTTECPLNQTFAAWGHSYASYRQAMLTYEEKADDYNAICSRIAARVEMHPEMIQLLKRVRKDPYVKAFVLTTGLREVWEMVLRKHGFDEDEFKVIGGGRLPEGYVVNGAIKGAVVDLLHEKDLRVVTFGQSILDIEMYEKADEVYLIAGGVITNSLSEEKALTKAITENRISALRILLPSAIDHRLDFDTLPIATLDNKELGHIFRHSKDPATRVHHATPKPSAKLFVTPPLGQPQPYSQRLYEFHKRVGFYLANEYVSSILGQEQICIPDGQDPESPSHRFRYEKGTLVNSLSDDGDAISLGVSEAMPCATLSHAKLFSDLDTDMLKGKRHVILVDSVIDTGWTTVNFIRPLRKLCPRIRIVVVVGAANPDAADVEPDAVNTTITHRFADVLRDDSELYVVALPKARLHSTGEGGWNGNLWWYEMTKWRKGSY